MKKKGKKLIALVMAVAVCAGFMPLQSVMAESEPVSSIEGEVSAGETEAEAAVLSEDENSGDTSQPATAESESVSSEAEEAEQEEASTQTALAATQEASAATLSENAIVDSGTCGANLTWELTGDGTLTITGTGEMSYWSNSSRVPWSDMRTAINNVIITDGVTFIGHYAFDACSNLTEISIPDSVTSIGSYVFRDCSSLTSISIPDSVSYIGTYVFSGCSSLEKIIIPDGVTAIGSAAFFYCSSLKEVTIPDSVTFIGDYAFDYCSSLEEITIPDGVSYIGRAAFSDCSSLTEITIPDGVTSIGTNTFNDCSSLEKVTIPGSVISIDERAFYECSNLAEISSLDNVTTIGTYAFYNCSSLTEISGLESITEIGTYAFYNCSSLTEISDLESVITIGYNAFYNCSSLREIAILGSLTTIEQRTFSGCSSLKKITIPDSVTSIGSYAFRDCSSLEEITIPDGVTDIGIFAFSNCSSLKEIMIPDDMISIENYTFINCSGLEKITIPDSVISIGSGVFWGCSSLTAITIPDGVTSIEQRTFSGCSSLKKITIPDSVTSIGSYAFRDCSSLEGITIPDGVTDIPVYAFYGCSSLTTITIPDGVTSIGNGAFSGCNSLTEITIPDNVTSVGEYAFQDCSSLTVITVPDGVSDIQRYTFYGCSALTSITISGNVTSIGIGAFQNCSNLKVITIPGSVTYIGSDAFQNCNSLSDVYYGGSEDDWDEITIGRYNNTYLTNATIHYNSTGPEDENGQDENGQLDFDEDPYFCVVGNTVTISATYTSESAPDEITWTCSEDDVVSFSGTSVLGPYEVDGETVYYISVQVTGETAGEYDITLDIDGLSATVSVTVSESQLDFDKESYSCNAGDTITISATYTSESAPDEITWTCSDDDVVSFSDTSVLGPFEIDGETVYYISVQITGETAGEYDITLDIDGLSATVSVTVFEPQLDFGEESYSCVMGNTVTILATYTSESAPDEITWTCINDTQDDLFDGILSLSNDKVLGPLDVDGETVYHISVEVTFEEGNGGWNGIYDFTLSVDGTTATTRLALKYPYFTLRVDTNQFENSWDDGTFETSYLNLLLGATDNVSTKSKILRESRKSLSSGACFGIVASMIYASEGKLTNLFGSTNYWDLEPSSPVLSADATLLDVINYYQLCQYSDNLSYSYETWKNTFTAFVDSFELKNTSLEDFLCSFVDEAKSSEESGIPFMLVYKYGIINTGGHLVVVCGYEWDSDTGKHKIRVYDCNAYHDEGNQSNYLYITVNKDYSSFSFTDANDNTLEDTWTSLKMITISDLENAAWNKLSDASVSALQAATVEDDSANEDTTQIYISAYQPFTLTNAEGQTLSYDGSDYIGDMAIYSCKDVGEANVEFVITTDASDSFYVENMEDGFEISAEIDGQYYMATAVGASTILLSKADGIVIEGDSYTFSAAFSTDMSSCELVQISGETTGTCKLKLTDDGVVLNTENSCSNITVETYQGVNYNKEVLDDNATTITVSDGDDGKVEIITSNHTHTPAEAVVENEIPATSTEDGSYDSVIYCSGCDEELSRETVIVPATGESDDKTDPDDGNTDDDDTQSGDSDTGDSDSAYGDGDDEDDEKQPGDSDTSDSDSGASDGDTDDDDTQSGDSNTDKDTTQPGDSDSESSDGNTDDDDTQPGDSDTGDSDSTDDDTGSITASETSNGTVTVTPSDAGAGDTVTITVTPDEGYELSDLIVTDENGNGITVTDNGDGTYSFVMPDGEVTVTTSFEEEAQAETGSPSDPDNSGSSIESGSADNSSSDDGSADDGSADSDSSASGSSDSGSSTSTTSPGTGDSADIGLWMTVLLAGGTGIAALILVRRRRAAK